MYVQVYIYTGMHYIYMSEIFSKEITADGALIENRPIEEKWSVLQRERERGKKEKETEQALKRTKKKNGYTEDISGFIPITQ